MKIVIAGLLFALALPVGAQRGGGSNRGGGGFGGNSRNDPFGTGRNQKNPFPKEPRQQKQRKEQKRPDCVSEIKGQQFPKKNPTHVCDQNSKGKWGWQKIKKEDKKPSESAS